MGRKDLEKRANIRYELELVACEADGTRGQHARRAAKCVSSNDAVAPLWIIRRMMQIIGNISTLEIAE
jgi:hypothetical protein